LSLSQAVPDFRLPQQGGKLRVTIWFNYIIAGDRVGLKVISQYCDFDLLTIVPLQRYIYWMVNISGEGGRR